MKRVDGTLGPTLVTTYSVEPSVVVSVGVVEMKEVHPRLFTIPEGEYSAMVEDAKFRSVNTRIGRRAFIDVTFCLLDPEVAEQMGRGSVSVMGSYTVDVLPNGDVDLSKRENAELDQLRQALGYDNSSPPWLPRLLRGGAGPVQVYVSLQCAEGTRDVLFYHVKVLGRLGARD